MICNAWNKESVVEMQSARKMVSINDVDLHLNTLTITTSKQMIGMNVLYNFSCF